MKLIYKVFICGGLLIGACTPKTTTVPTIELYKYEALQLRCDSLESSLFVAKDTINVLDSIIKQRDSLIVLTQQNYDEIVEQNIGLRTDVTEMNFKILRIKEYCDIVKKNNSQLKYLRGWIMRVLED